MFFFFFLFQKKASISFFFFFQAEDGIRDGTVTGVQTCALPICAPAPYGAIPWNRPPASRRNMLCRSRSARKARQGKWTSRHRRVAGGARNSPAWQCAPGQPFPERGDNRCNPIRGWCPLRARPASILLLLERKGDGSRRARWFFPNARPSPAPAKVAAQARRRLLHPFSRMRPSMLPRAELQAGIATRPVQ